MVNNLTTLNNGLYLVATPIGNLKDISFRAVEILEKSEIILCENPKHSLKLLKEYGIKKKLISFHDHNEEALIKKISLKLKNSIISLISDAGSPLISDPGYKLIKHCIKNEVYITSIPGASSIIIALQLSGIPLNNFNFHGFIPKKNKQASELLESASKNAGAQIFLSSSFRLKENLKLIEGYFNNRNISICKELTKLNENIIRNKTNNISKSLNLTKSKMKGEFILVIEGSDKKVLKYIDNEIINSILEISKKFSLTDTVKIVHNLTRISKKGLYNAALERLKK